MKIQHYAIIFIILILPFSIVCKTKINDKIDTLAEETRINHALDTATYDAIDTIRDLNDEFYFMYDGQTIDITPSIAMEGIKTFYETMSVNYTLPFVGDESFNHHFFSSYIPAVLVIAYDGFYVYSMEQNPTTSVWEYSLSPKIPYTKKYKGKDGKYWYVNYSLGNYIRLYTPDGNYFQGAFSKDFIDDDNLEEEYNSIQTILGGSVTYEQLINLGADMSLLIKKLRDDSIWTGVAPDDLKEILCTMSTDGKPSMLSDYKSGMTDYSTVSDFHKERRSVIVDIVVSVLNEKMNQHNRYADMMGVTYDFFLPPIPNSEWMNAIDDISIMAFVQGIPIGRNSYYNSYALGSSRIIQTEYIYGTSGDVSITTPEGIELDPGGTEKIYHIRSCPLVREDIYDDNWNITTIGNVEEIFVNRYDAARKGYYPCRICRP